MGTRFECNFYSILQQIFIFSLFILSPLICVASYYEFVQDYANGRSPISLIWISFNIVAVLYYVVDWLLDQRWDWVRAYFHVTNILLSESCAWLSILKFFSTDPFAAVYDGWSKTPELYVFVGTTVIISWLTFVILHALMNTSIHFLMVYHMYHETKEKITRYSNMLRASFGILCGIFQCALIFLIPIETRFYCNVFISLQILLCITILLNLENLIWGREANEENPYEKLYWRTFSCKTFMGCFRIMCLLSSFLVAIALLNQQLPQQEIQRSFTLYKIHIDEIPEQDSLQSYNLIPFIACVQIFSTIREYLLKRCLEKDETSKCLIPFIAFIFKQWISGRYSRQNENQGTLAG